MLEAINDNSQNKILHVKICIFFNLKLEDRGNNAAR